jgi:hypothetical protein
LSKGVVSRDYLLSVYDNYCKAGYGTSFFELKRRDIEQYVPMDDSILKAKLEKCPFGVQRSLGDWTNNCVPAAASFFLPDTAHDAVTARQLLAREHQRRCPPHCVHPQWYTSSYASVPVVALSHLLSASERGAFLVVTSSTGKWPATPSPPTRSSLTSVRSASDTLFLFSMGVRSSIDAAAASRKLREDSQFIACLHNDHLSVRKVDGYSYHPLSSIRWCGHLEDHPPAQSWYAAGDAGQDERLPVDLPPFSGSTSSYVTNRLLCPVDQLHMRHAWSSPNLELPSPVTHTHAAVSSCHAPHTRHQLLHGPSVVGHGTFTVSPTTLALLCQLQITPRPLLPAHHLLRWSSVGFLAAFRDAFLAGELVVASGNASPVLLALAGMSPIKSDQKLANEVSVSVRDEEVQWSTGPRQPNLAAPSRELICAFNCGGECAFESMRVG